MPRITSTITVTNNSESKVVQRQSFETPSSTSKKQDLTFLTQSMQSMKDVDVNLLTDLGKKQQEAINKNTTTSNSSSTKKKQQRSSEEDEDDGLNGEDDEDEDMKEDDDDNNNESKIKKIKNGNE